MSKAEKISKIMDEVDILMLEYLDLGGDPSYAAKELKALSEIFEELSKIDPLTLN